MDNFIMGATAMASAVVGLFFLRFWRTTGDRLFLIFSLAFLLLGMTRIALAATHQGDDHRMPLYFIRLAAFLLILFAIIDKNWTRPKADAALTSSEPPPR